MIDPDVRPPCQRYDPEWWFSDDSVVQRFAAHLCREECPVRTACLVKARQNRETFGVWGGYLFGKSRARAI